MLFDDAISFKFVVFFCCPLIDLTKKNRRCFETIGLGKSCRRLLFLQSCLVSFYPGRLLLLIFFKPKMVSRLFLL